MAWVPLPFPECPGCKTAWDSCRHKSCTSFGELKLNPDQKTTRCDGCGETWSVWNTRYYCSCGRMFTTDEVRDAVHESIRAAQLLAEIIDRHARDFQSIHQASRSSYRSWLDGIAAGLGGVLGKALGYAIGALFRGL